MSTQWSEPDTARIVPAGTAPQPHPRHRHEIRKETPAEHTAAYLVKHCGTGEADSGR